MASTQVAYGALNNEILGRRGGITEISVELDPSAPCVGVLQSPFRGNKERERKS